jgi:hypothetical protein
VGHERLRDEAAAGRVEDDRPGQEEPLGGDVAAIPRRGGSFLRALCPAPRHRARRARRGARGDLSGVRSSGGSSRRAFAGRNRIGFGCASRRRRRTSDRRTPSPEPRAPSRSDGHRCGR